MRIAVIGLGEAGRTIHLPALARVPGAEIVGVCDRDEERRGAVAKERPDLPSFETLDETLERTRPDVVVVGTPPGTHADLCVRSLQAGCHVICEKPFASSLEEADRMIAAAHSAGRGIAVNHEFKELPTFRAVIERVAAAGEGEPRFAQAWQLMHQPPWTESGWRGGLKHRTLYEAGVHLVDFLVALFREMPRSVTATISSGGEAGRDVDAVVTATLEFSRGRMAQLVQTRLCRGAMRYFEARADTADASYRASHGGRARLSMGLYHSTRPHVQWDYGLSGLAWKEVGVHRTVLARNPRSPLVHATAEVFRRTLDAFHEGTTPPVPGLEARTLLGVIAACYESSETGRRIHLDGGHLAELSKMRLGGGADAT